MHLLQHKHQVIRRQELETDCCRRDFRRLISRPLQRHLRLLDHTSEECLRLRRPLLKILLAAREFLRTTKAFHIDGTRSVLPNLSCREIVDRSRCIGTCSIVMDSSGHSRFRVRLQTTAPPAFHRTQVRQATKVQQPRSTREHDTTAEVSRPAVHHHTKGIEQRSPQLCAPSATNHHATMMK